MTTILFFLFFVLTCFVEFVILYLFKFVNSYLGIINNIISVNSYYVRLINGLIGELIASFVKFSNSPFHTDSHPCIR